MITDLNIIGHLVETFLTDVRADFKRELHSTQTSIAELERFAP